MLIFKTSAATLESVLVHSKHASKDNLQAQPGELILIQQTLSTLKAGEKSIQWVMEYEETYADTFGESEQIWQRRWPYIIRCSNPRRVEPFNITELQVSTKNYGSAMKYAWIDSLDELVIRDWICLSQDELVDLDEEVELMTLNAEEILIRFDSRYSGPPRSFKKIIKMINRPSSLRKAIIECYGTTCKICGSEGFLKKNGERYCELHHMIELNTGAPNTLQHWNILILCPSCHRQMHYGRVESEFLNPGWRIRIDENIYEIT